jgi:hypothetical protein
MWLDGVHIVELKATPEGLENVCIASVEQLVVGSHAIHTPSGSPPFGGVGQHQLRSEPGVCIQISTDKGAINTPAYRVVFPLQTAKSIVSELNRVIELVEQT